MQSGEKRSEQPDSQIRTAHPIKTTQTTNFFSAGLSTAILVPGDSSELAHNDAASRAGLSTDIQVQKLDLNLHAHSGTKNEQPNPVAHSIKCTYQPATKFFNGAGLSTDILVRITGLEPARRRHQILNLARLPIPPYPHVQQFCGCIAAARIKKWKSCDSPRFPPVYPVSVRGFEPRTT